MALMLIIMNVNVCHFLLFSFLLEPAMRMFTRSIPLHLHVGKTTFTAYHIYLYKNNTV
jgi:hypothetical protein